MTRRFLASVSVGVLTAALAAMSAPVWAADAQAPNPNAAPTLSEVVITAQKRPEKLESTAVAASVLAPANLDRANATDISDLNNLVPSVELNGSVNGRVPAAVRGVSTDSNEATVGISSGVAIMVDGMPIPSDSVAGNGLEDVAQIEVLKGPQSTLGGRAAAAGVINIVTHGPTDFFTGQASATATGDGEVRISGDVSGPIVHGVDFSLSGWDTRLDYPIKNTETNQTTYQINDGARAKLKFDLTPDLTVTVGGRYSQTDSHGGNFVYTYLTPGSDLLFPGSAANQAAMFQYGITPSYSNSNYASPVSNTHSLATDQDAFINIAYTAGELVLSSNTSYLHESQNNIQDLFDVSGYFWNIATGGFAPPFYNMQLQVEEISQFAQEFKLVSPASADFSYIVGAFMSRTTVNEYENRPFPPADVDIYVKPTTSTYALYGRDTWKITPNLSLITGLRYNYDVIEYNYNQILYLPQTAQQSNGKNSGGTLVGDATLQYKFNSRSMIYGTYSRGYSPAAYNTAIPLANNNPLTPVQKEIVDDFEIGSKGEYFSRRLTFNIDLFYTKYNNYQIQTYEALPGYVTPPLALVNGDASTRGVEMDTNWAATRTLNVSLNAAYIDAKFDKYDNAPCYGTNQFLQQPSICVLDAATGQYTQNVSGKTLPNSPKLKFTLAGDQRIPLTIVPFDLDLNGTYAYRTSAQMLADQNPEAVQKAFGILNLSLTLLSHAGPYSITAFVNNVGNTHYYTDVEDFWTAPWSGQNTIVAQPARDFYRYSGVRLNAKF